MAKKKKTGVLQGYVQSWLSPYIKEQAKLQAKSLVEKELVKASVNEKAIPTPAGSRSPINYISRQTASYDAGLQIQLYEGWVYACVKKLAESGAQIPLQLFESNSKGVEEIHRHEATDLLYRVNDFMGYYDFMEAIITYLQLTGEAFVWKERAANGKIIGLYPWLMPHRMTVIPGSERFIDGYVYRPIDTGDQIPFDPEDIIHFRFTNPMNPYRGISPVRAAFVDIDTERAAKKFNQKFFQNDATPRGILQTEEKLDQDTFERIKIQFENNHQGYDNAYKVALLEQGLTYSEAGMSHADMDFINQRTFSRDSILAIFGVPKSILGITEDVNRANSETSKEVFLEETITPLLTKIVSTLNEQMITPDFGEELFLDFEDLTPEDQDKKFERYRVLNEIGAVSINEIRALEGFPEVPNGNELYKPFNLQSITSGSKPEPEKAAPAHITKRHRTKKQLLDEAIKGGIKEMNVVVEKSIKTPVHKIVNKTKASDSSKCRMSNESEDQCLSRKIPEIMNEDPSLGESRAIAIAASYCKIPCEGGEPKKKDENGWSAEQKMILWKQLDLGIRKQVPFFKKKIKEVYAGQEKRVLQRLDGKKTTKRDIEAFLLAVSEEVDEFEKILLAPTISIILESGNTAAEIFAVIDAKIKEPDARRFAQASIKKFAKSNTTTINKELSNVLIDAFENGDSIPKIKDKVRSVYAGISDAKAEQIARTELTRTTTWSNEQIYKQAGVTQVEWQVNPGACQFCLPLAGKRYTIGSSLYKKGDVIVGLNGQELDVNYENIQRPPAHVSCRCNLLPVIVF